MRELLQWGRQLGSSLLFGLALIYAILWLSDRDPALLLVAGLSGAGGLALLVWARLMPWD